MILEILCITYMMIIVLIQAAWIRGIMRHDGKCHYHNCGHCPYDGWCPMQENRKSYGEMSIGKK